MNKSSECVFCRIAVKEMNSSILFEDKKTMAFLDINPISEGHSLVIPKTHSENIFEMSEEDLCAVIKTVQLIGKAIQKAVNADAINVGVNSGKAAGQIVFHSHFHIIPRFHGDGFTHWERNKSKEFNLGHITELIKKEIK
ncbi:MAG TPA: HIT family protein [archaeon]|nr:HIT family protein [archaeon]